MNTPAKLLALLATPALIASSSAPKPIRLAWGPMKMLMASDSAHGTMIWMSEGPAIDSAPDHRKNFATFVKPDLAAAWIKNARAFVKIRLSDSDTGSLRLSGELLGEEGDAVLFARRRVGGKWSNERILILQNHDVRQPWMIIGTEQQVGQFLDALESTNRRTVISQDAAAQDSVQFSNPFDTSANPIPNPENLPPVYPQTLRQQHVEGDVWVSFVVTPDGRADINTLRILFSDDAGFSGVVKQALRTHRYKPATSNGVPVSKRVFQQFSFALRR